MNDRNLKYRAWDGKRMAYMDLDGLLDLCNTYTYTGNLNPNKSGGMPCLLVDECDPLMQFTTFKDKNKKDIYDKDILKCNGKKYKLVKHESGAYELHALFNEANSGPYFLFNHFGKMEVCGNELQNPDFLKF